MKAMVVSSPGGLDALVELSPIRCRAATTCSSRSRPAASASTTSSRATARSRAACRCRASSATRSPASSTTSGREVRGFKPGDRVATAQRYHICGAAGIAAPAARRSAPSASSSATGAWSAATPSSSRSRTTTSPLVPDGVPLARGLDRRLRDRHRSQRDARRRASSSRAKARSSPAPAAGSGIHAHPARAPRRRVRHRADDLAGQGRADPRRSARTRSSCTRAARISPPQVKRLTGGERRRRRDRQCRQPLFEPIRRSLGIARALDPDRPAHRPVRAVQPGAALPQEPVRCCSVDQHLAQSARGRAGAGGARRRSSRSSRARSPLEEAGAGARADGSRPGQPGASSCARTDER